MRNVVVGGAIAALFLAAGCASQEGATMKSLGQSDAPQVTVKDGKRQEVMVGSRLSRDTRESAESVKSISRKGYEEGMREKPGSGLDGGG